MEHFGRLIAACLIVVSMSSSVFGAKTMKQAIDEVSESLGKYCKRIDAERIRVERPRGPADHAATTRLQIALVEAVEKQGLKVGKNHPDCMVAWEYIPRSGSGRYSMTIRLRDRDGRTLGSFGEKPGTQRIEFVEGSNSETFDVEVDPIERTIIEGRSVDTTLTPTGETIPATRAGLEKALRGDRKVNIEKDPKSTTRSVVSAARGSRFRIEILAKRGDIPGEYRPRRAEEIDGVAFCDLQGGEVFAVRVTNDSKNDVLVDLSIDGINMWHTSSNPTWKKNGKFLIRGKSETTMRGWHFGENGDASDYREFKVEQLPDSLVASLGSDQAPVGQISALFYVAPQPGRPWPAASPPLAGVTVRYTRPDHDIPDD